MIPNEKPLGKNVSKDANVIVNIIVNPVDPVRDTVKGVTGRAPYPTPSKIMLSAPRPVKARDNRIKAVKGHEEEVGEAETKMNGLYLTMNNSWPPRQSK